MAFFLTLFSLLVDLLLVLTLTAPLAYWYVKHSYSYWSKRKVHHLTPHFPFGNLEAPRRKTATPGLHIARLYHQIRAERWRHAGVYFFLRPLVLIADLDHLQLVLTRHFDHFADRGMYSNEKNDPISGHLFALGGDRWRHLRSNLTPTFTAAKMRAMFVTLEECVGQLLEIVAKNEVGLNAKEVLGRFTTDVIGSCAFGLNCNAIQEEDSPFRVYGKKVFESSRWRQLKLSFASTFPTLGRFLRVSQVSKEVSAFFTGIVLETIRYRKQEGVTRADFLQMLIELMDEGLVTQDQVVAQAFIFFLAGFETSSTAMTFALFELARNEEVQDRVRKEIEMVLVRHDGKATFDALNEMTYLNQVVDETLRMYPPLPFVTRTCVKDYRMPGEGSVTVEKGIRLIVPILGIHYDEELYPQPEVFDPERFSDKNKAARHSYAYLPFGEGPRNCIGMRFGLCQTKIGLVALLRKYRFAVNAKTRQPVEFARNSFILTAEGGIWLDAKPL